MGSALSHCWPLCTDCPPLATPTQNSASPSALSIPIARSPASNNHYSAAGPHSTHYSNQPPSSHHPNLPPVPLLKSTGAVESASQIDFFRMLDDKIQHGPDLSESDDDYDKS
ncbi:hypothetical protein WR25_14194 [Diploscapter pachys]|uniref:Uncharacterized protein n=1 Tax=Diploscapter pachys TaxID=2018661 RepID=A0A2A2LZ77_9BILA|nr:hypothetical protein WR25_14194 [Diploscapter pachys]